MPYNNTERIIDLYMVNLLERESLGLRRSLKRWSRELVILRLSFRCEPHVCFFVKVKVLNLIRWRKKLIVQRDGSRIKISHGKDYFCELWFVGFNFPTVWLQIDHIWVVLNPLTGYSKILVRSCYQCLVCIMCLMGCLKRFWDIVDENWL